MGDIVHYFFSLCKKKSGGIEQVLELVNSLSGAVFVNVEKRRKRNFYAVRIF